MERFGIDIATVVALGAERCAPDRALAGNNLGNALQEVRRFDEATRAWGEAVAAYDDAGDRESTARVQRWPGDIGPGDGSASAC